MIEPRRNDPCPCGSGLKYKKCCLNQDSTQPTQTDPLAEPRSRAYKEMSEENWHQAISLFKNLIEAEPGNHVLLEATASCHEGLEQYLDAAEYYEKALQACPESKKAELWYRLGVARACGNRMEKAADAFRTCIELHHDPGVIRNIRKVLGLVEEILAGKENPQVFQIHVQLQRAFSDMEEERFSSAARRLEAIVSLEPDNPAIFYNLGVVYTFLKREDEALAGFERCVELYPDYAEAWYNMGQIHLIGKKDFSRALHCFDRAATIRPDYIGAHHQKGLAYELLGDRQKALRCWERALELDPENEQARHNKERVLKMVEKRSHAEEKRKDTP